MNPRMSDAEIDAVVQGEAAAGLRFAADKQGLPVHGWNIGELARNTVYRAMGAAVSYGLVVSARDHEAAIADGERRIRQWTTRACVAERDAGHQRIRMQAALSALDDRALADKIAGQVGVMLLPAGGRAKVLQVVPPDHPATGGNRSKPNRRHGVT